MSDGERAAERDDGQREAQRPDGGAEPDGEDAKQRYNQPVRTLEQAHGGVDAEGLGAGSRIGDQEAEGQAGQGEPQDRGAAGNEPRPMDGEVAADGEPWAPEDWEA